MIADQSALCRIVAPVLFTILFNKDNVNCEGSRRPVNMYAAAIYIDLDLL